MTGASAEWAITASKLRFGPEARIEDRRETAGPSGCARYVVLLGTEELGLGPTWEAAFKDAHDKNQHIPQPTPEMFYREDTAPSGEEFIEEFAGALRQRNLPTEFLLWYGEKSDEDPEAYPMALQRKEWLEQFAAFLDDLKE